MRLYLGKNHYGRYELSARKSGWSSWGFSDYRLMSFCGRTFERATGFKLARGEGPVQIEIQITRVISKVGLQVME